MSKYIDVDEVLEQIRKKLGIKSLDYLLEAERQIVDAIQSAPSIDIEPKRGEWLEWIDCEGEVFWKCSACGQASEASAAGILYKFCPFCGADMRGKDDE